MKPITYLGQDSDRFVEQLLDTDKTEAIDDVTMVAVLDARQWETGEAVDAGR